MRVHHLPLVKQIDRLLAALHRHYMRQYEQAVNWTNKRCQKCNAPVAFDGAKYCSFCSTQLCDEWTQEEYARLGLSLPETKNDRHEGLPIPPVIDDVERHTSGIHKVVLEREIAQAMKDVEVARAHAKTLEPPDTFTARLQAVMKPGERPLQAYLREMKPKEGKG